VILDVDDSDSVVKQEQFGPLIPLIKYSNIDEVIAKANHLDFGLASSVSSNNID
jgi:acyl-CoA reductase-like NAD-dependent aldehyde dehydrogenase